jgi:tripartite-type tricarboxylate transporter receptor subunit TctC
MTRSGRLGLIALVLALSAGSAAAQEFPTRPISLVLPMGAGGASDLLARTFIGAAPEVLGQPIVLEMRAGASGTIAAELVAQARPDGHTLLFGHTNTNSILPAIEGRSKGPDDLLAVCRVNVAHTVFLARPDAPFTSLRELIAWARGNPDRLTVSVVGTWSTIDFAWRRMERDFGLKLRIVPFPGGAEALAALLGGHVQASLLALPQSLPYVRGGALRPLAWTGPTRHRDLPEVPTAAEEGVPGIPSSFRGVLAPKGTPRPVVEKLARAFQRMLETPVAVEAIHRLGEEVDYLGPDQFERYWRAEYETFRALGQLFKR